MTDYHNHLLPHMDDGAKDLGMSQGMLSLLRSQGVERVVATPHYYSHREKPEKFLERRRLAWEELGEADVLLGAEVRVERGLSELEGVRGMTLGSSRYILLELPYAPYKEWMAEEICNVSYQFQLTPVLAHVDRYTEWYSKDELRQVLSIPEAVIQLNNEALFRRKTLRFALDLIRAGTPVVFGSDAHNLSERPPNFDRAIPLLKDKLPAGAFPRLSHSLLP